MRVAVFGGSFNPPHLGHAMVAAWVRWADRADEVWFTPTLQHAFDKSLAPWSARAAACEELAALLGGWASVCRIEAELPVPSYTVRTLDALAARHADVEFRLVLGADAWEQRASWHQWSRIEKVYSPIVVGRGARPGLDAPAFPDLSSTEVRRRLAAGEPVDAWVPARVLSAWSDRP